MPENTTRDAKLIQYLNEAYGKEKQLETALEAHIAMTTRPPYKRRLREHLKETKGHARAVERRIKQLGGAAGELSIPGPEVASEVASRVQEVAHRGVALAQGPLHAVRGTGEEEKLLKNAKSEFSDEAEEIANYTAIETLAVSVGDRETARMARGIRRQEERMSSFLERLIPQLTKAVAQAEIPASERNGGRKRRSSGRSTSGTRRKTTARRKPTSRRATTARRKTTSRRNTTARRTGTSRRTGASRRTTTVRATVSASTRRSGGRRSAPKRRTRARA
jgi:ferritin-like metal-binding protein YciE